MTTDTLSPAEADEFRAKVRAFLSEHTAAGAGLAEGKAFNAKLAEAGLGGIVFDKAYGGAGLTKNHDRIFREEAARYPTMTNDFVISHGMCLPVVNDFGTEEQKKRYLPDVIAGNTLWCQMFSEPGAGSDVASLQTKAERDGDEWIINGQKVWTTLAHVSDYAVLIARTNPEAVKHAGISMFILPMDAPGVETRPIHQIDGGRHFNEVFFTDVRIPADHLLGELNNGWNQATAMLMYERVAIGTIGGGKISQPNFKMLLAAARQGNRVTDPNVRQDLARIYSMETTKSLMAQRTRAEMQSGKAPGPGGSLGKLFGSVIQWRMRDLLMNLAGPGAQAWAGNGWNDPGGVGVTAEEPGALAKQTVGSFSSSIAGGTDEIQRNIIGDRVLGLPRDIAVDRGMAFNELKVGTQREAG